MIAWIVATIVAFFIKGLCGFANTLIFTSILGFATNNINISPVELVLGYPTNVILTWRNRKSLVKQIYIPLLILVMAGTIPGTFVLKNTDVGLVKILFGILIIAVGVELLFREKGKIFLQDSKLILLVLGIISGIVCGLFGVGALVAAYVGRITKNTDEFKANISIVFLVENTFRIFLYTYLRIITVQSLKQAALMAPLMLISLFAGIKCSQRVNDKIIKKLVIILLIASGVVLIWKNL